MKKKKRQFLALRDQTQFVDSPFCFNVIVCIFSSVLFYVFCTTQKRRNLKVKLIRNNNNNKNNNNNNAVAKKSREFLMNKYWNGIQYLQYSSCFRCLLFDDTDRLCIAMFPEFWQVMEKNKYL